MKLYSINNKILILYFLKNKFFIVRLILNMYRILHRNSRLILPIISVSLIKRQEKSVIKLQSYSEFNLLNNFLLRESATFNIFKLRILSFLGIF